jgi:hypothetical protein
MKTASLLRVLLAASLAVNATDIPDVSDYTTDYVDSQANIQLLSNRSETHGPVFYLNDVAVYMDRPALRVISLISEARALIAKSEGSRRASQIWKQVKRGWPPIRDDL